MLPSAEMLLALLQPMGQCQEQASYRPHIAQVCPHLGLLRLLSLATLGLGIAAPFHEQIHAGAQPVVCSSSKNA